MSLVAVKTEFSRRELLWFGPLFALFVGLICYCFVWSNFSPSVTYVICGLAATLILIYYGIPPFRRPIYLGWMYSVLPIGFVISHVLLALVYFLMFTPVGLLMKLVGYDPMHRKFDREVTSYWIRRGDSYDSQRYFRQF